MIENTATKRRPARPRSTGPTPLECAVRDTIRLYGENGATVRELVDTMRRPQVSISPTTTKLESRGMLVRTGERRRHAMTGHSGIVWVTPEFADPAPDVLYLQWDQNHWPRDVAARATWNEDRLNKSDVKYVRAR